MKYFFIILLAVALISTFYRQQPTGVRSHAKLCVPNECYRPATLHAAPLRRCERGMHTQCREYSSSIVRAGSQIGESRNGDDTVQSKNVQQRIISMDKMCRKISIRHVCTHGYDGRIRIAIVFHSH